MIDRKDRHRKMRIVRRIVAMMRMGEMRVERARARAGRGVDASIRDLLEAEAGRESWRDDGQRDERTDTTGG